MPLCVPQSPYSAFLQYPTIAYNILQYPTISYNILQYRTISCNILQYPTISYNILALAPVCPTIPLFCFPWRHKTPNRPRPGIDIKRNTMPVFNIRQTNKIPWQYFQLCRHCLVVFQYCLFSDLKHRGLSIILNKLPACYVNGFSPLVRFCENSIVTT